MQNYEQKATDFLNKNNITIDIIFKRNDFYFNDDKDKRDIYNITIARGNRSMNFDYGQSIKESGYKVIFKYKNTARKFEHNFINSDLYISKNFKNDIFKLCYTKFGYDTTIESITPPTPPTTYDVLSCLTYSDPGTFEDFCLELGYNNDSIKDLELYKRVVKEYQQVLTIFSDQEIEEIQDFL